MFLRSMFTARGIAIVIGAEHHASLFGAMNNSFLSLDIWVDAEDGDEAIALLSDLRNRTPGGADGTESPDEDDEDDEDDQPGEPMHVQLERRRRTAVVLLLGLFFTFGTAHMYTRAWLRGLALAAIEIAGLWQIVHHHEAGGFAIMTAVVVDVVGATWRVRASRNAQLPAAHARLAG